MVTPAWVGDLVMCQTLLKVLAARHPAATLDVLVPPWGVALAGRMPEVSRAVALPVKHGELALGVRWRIARALRAAAYDQAIVVKRTFKSALIPWLAAIPRRTGVRGEARYGLINDVRRPPSDAIPLNHARYAALALEPGRALDADTLPAPALRVDRGNRARLLERLDLDPGKGPVGFAPGAAYGPAKRWPETHWIRLGRSVVDGGRALWIFGSEAEADQAERIRKAVGGGAWNLAGRTRLEDVVDLASCCTRFVSNDSGLMHLAAAAGTHVVALFGSTSPRRTPPLGQRRTILWRGLSCSPCFARECPLGHLDCLTGISPEEVRGALDGP